MASFFFTNRVRPKTGQSVVDPLGRLVLVMSMYLLINSGETALFLEIECVICCIYWLHSIGLGSNGWS